MVISSVQYDSPGRDDRSNRSLNKEWVDITNPTRRAVNLDDWTLTDEAGHTTPRPSATTTTVSSTGSPGASTAVATATAAPSAADPHGGVGDRY